LRGPAIYALTGILGKPDAPDLRTNRENSRNFNKIEENKQK
jgi:hypothetical protein